MRAQWRFILAAAVLTVSYSASAENQCRSLWLEDSAQIAKLHLRYGVNESQIRYTPNTRIPVILKMSDHETLAPKIPVGTPIAHEIKKYDIVVAGGGPAGLTAALFLAEAGKSVLILERNPQLGGLAIGGELKGIRAGGGAAYSAGPDGGLEYKIFQKIGLGQYKKKLSIEEPIDSYLWNGKLYKGIWEEHTLHELPASFSLFKHALLKLSKMGAKGDTGKMAEWADNMDMATLVRQMPELVRTWKDAASKKMMKQYDSEARTPGTDPMRDVIELLDLYGRSALGGTAKQISARQFIDFYESEIYTRYTGTLGTGTIAEALINKLSQFPNVEFRTSAPVAAVENTAMGTKTTFIENGVPKDVQAGRVIFAAAVKSAPVLIKDLAKQDPEKVKAISDIQMSDYAVHVARVKGHPYRATYDTWSASGGDMSKPTDFILGRWQDAKIKAYEGMREFEKEPVDDYGVISIYQPMGASNKANFTEAQTLKTVESALQDMTAKISSLKEETKQPIEIELVETYRWPESIHIVSPGYLKKIPVLARPVGKIHFANNTIAAPELETSMARAAQEAMKILEEDGMAQRQAN